MQRYNHSDWFWRSRVESNVATRETEYCCGDSSYNWPIKICMHTNLSHL